MWKRLIERIVDGASHRPKTVIAVALALTVAAWAYASKLELRSDFLELLPRDSPGFVAFERQLGRVGGGATLVVVVESPDRAANAKMIDDLGAALRADPDARAKIAYVEDGTKEVRAFFERNRWLYASLADLEETDRTLERETALRSGLVEDLGADDPPATATAPRTATAPPESGSKMRGYRERWEAHARSRDDFPTGYFESDDGTMFGVRIVSTSTGTGDASGDTLLGIVQAHVGRLDPTARHAAMVVGYAGDIPNAAAEKQSLLSEAAVATGLALLLVLGGIAWFYRTPWALPLVGFPPIFGVGYAYAFATARYGFVNSSGAFLGAIILGNGVNYPIVLYSRYREFRARGMDPATARRDAVTNAFRAELVGASVAAIAYGSLTVTRFRGFSQFGTIGFVGMLLVWISMIPCVPAMIVLLERLEARLPRALRQAPPRLDEDGSRGLVSRVVGELTERRPWVILGIAAVVTIAAVAPLPRFLADPWEYNFHKLGSRGSQRGGAGEWSNKAERVFRGKLNVGGAMMLADRPEQVSELRDRILAADRADPRERLIADVATVHDLLPGTRAEQEKKLAVLASIRDRATPVALSRMSPAERADAEAMRPPEGLAPLEPRDLPGLLRRRFEERNGTVGTVFYVRYAEGVSLSDGHNLLRIAAITDDVELGDGTRVQTASRSTVFAEMLRSMERDGPLATGASFVAVAIVVVLATRDRRGTAVTLAALLLGVCWMVGGASWLGERLNFLNFIALPITFGIGSEYPFNIYDRSRLLGGDVTRAVKLHLGAVVLCSYTTIVGYGSLVVADNQALQSFGRWAMAGEATCLFATLFFLPALLHVLARRGSARVGTRPIDGEGAKT